MELDVNEREGICNFFNACNKLIEGKFLIYSKKISNVLQSIVASKVLYKLYSSCMMDFNFEREYALAVATNPNNGGYFVMPDDENKIIAFTTSLLLEVDKGKISLENFINQNFYTGEGQNYDHKNFAQTILIPYKTAVKNVLNIDEEGNMLEVEDEDSENYFQMTVEDAVEDVEYENSSKKLFANLIISVNTLYATISSDIRIKSSMREEICLVLKALNKAINLEQLLIINALLVHLEYTLGRNKKYKYEYNNLKESLADFYYS